MTLDCLEPPLETRGRLAALIDDAKVDAEKDSGRPDLSARRSLKLPNPQKIDATAEYWILLSPGSQPNSSSVEAAKFIAIDDDYEKPATGNSADAAKSSAGNSPVGSDKSDRAPDAKLQAALTAYATSLRAARFRYFFPAGETTKILPRGVLACSNIAHSCTFTPFPADQTYRLALTSFSSTATR